MTKPAMAQGVFATTVTTFQMSPMGHTVIERRINDSVQTSESSVSLTTDSQSGSSQTSNSEEGKTTRTNYNYGTTATSVAIENIDITREVKVEFREEYNYSEFSIDNSSSTGYSF
ncbi:hypothetical protein [Acaryochloris sp. IP29b_bin.137]|uniref:hypothetical protein n=1 Tax=Acaryochloris sp. IP29b_bin.137 TaxID=2969217 RepID=UPI00260C1D5A|nr:hypothetical protein [Acaryochloris sp. IP29b_bin.137]